MKEDTVKIEPATSSCVLDVMNELQGRVKLTHFLRLHLFASQMTLRQFRKNFSLRQLVIYIFR